MEYKITFKADNGAVILKRSQEGVEIIEANSAAEAIENFKEKNASNLTYLSLYDINFFITNVEKV